MSDKSTDNTPNDEMSYPIPPSLEGMEILELGNNVDYTGYQVCRGEYYADNRSPYITFYKQKFYCNAACLRLFPDVDYVQILINAKVKMMTLRPCDPYARDAFRWCNVSKGKRVVRQAKCKFLFADMMTLMKWNQSCKVSLLGNIVHANNEFVLSFNLNSPKYYPTIQNEDGTTTLSRNEVFKEEWKGTFGMPYEEHLRYSQISVLNEFAVLTVEDQRLRAKKSIVEITEGESEHGSAILGSDIDHRPEEKQVSGEQTNTDSDRNA